jgi:hypothetical protein
LLNASREQPARRSRTSAPRRGIDERAFDPDLGQPPTNVKIRWPEPPRLVHLDREAQPARHLAALLIHDLDALGVPTDDTLLGRRGSSRKRRKLPGVQHRGPRGAKT